MNTLTFTCRTITPMFLSGADGHTPELRPSSIKGALRFWWRAMHNALGPSRLYDEEALIFGGMHSVKGAVRSQIVITTSVIEPADIGGGKMLEHKSEWASPAIKPGRSFEVQLHFKEGSKVNEKYLKNLFLLFSILGGLGKRCRRGFGSFEVTHINDQAHTLFLTHRSICELLTDIVPNGFKDGPNYIKNIQHPHAESKYPFIECVEMGLVDQDNLTKTIGAVTSDQKENYGQDYEFALGHARKPRFASPVFVSAISASRCIITTLHTIPREGVEASEKQREKQRVIQRKFRDELLYNYPGMLNG